MTTGIVNLDAVCAGCGYEIVSGASDKNKVENVVTRSLGVLQEQGVYAFFLFLDYYQGRNEGRGAADAIREKTLALLKEQAMIVSTNDASGVSYQDLQTLATNLDNLLLARQLLEQTLIYARYHAKALHTNNQNDAGGQ